MLDSTLIGAAVVSALQNIPTLVTALGGESSNISLHAYEYGVDFRLMEAVNKMVTPSILIAWGGVQGGNFSGQQIWKHAFRGFARIANQAGSGSPISLSDLWLLIVNGKLASPTLNIRQIQIYPGTDIMDTPSCEPRVDEEGMDYLEFRFVIPEIGDN